MPHAPDETFDGSTDLQASFPSGSGKRSAHPPSQTQFDNSESLPRPTSLVPDPLVDIQILRQILFYRSTPTDKPHHVFSRPTQDPPRSAELSTLLLVDAKQQNRNIYRVPHLAGSTTE